MAQKKVVNRKGVEAQFLESVFSDSLVENEDLRILIWTIPGTHRANESVFFDSPVSAGDYCRKVRDSRDVYFGLGFRDTNIPDGKRGGEKEIRGTAGFAIDLDIQDEHRTKKNLFQSRSEAMDLLMGLRNAPTTVVQSGNGLHAYWLFDEPWIFESASDWESARRMSFGWQRHIKDQVDYEIDSTHPLERVWRVPGTWNHKYDDAVLVEVIHNDDFRRYEPDDDFAMFAASLDQVAAANPLSERLKIKVDFNVAVPEVVKAQLVANEEFARLWHHIKKLNDTSQSGYDFAIGHYGKELGWSSDEVLAAIVSNRRMKSGNLKMDNPGYYSLTMTKIFGLEFDGEAKSAKMSTMDQFSKVVGMPIVEITKYGTQDGRSSVIMYVTVEKGNRKQEIRVGDIKEFRKLIAWRDLKALYFPESVFEGVSKKAFDVLVDQVMMHVKDGTSVDDSADVSFLTHLDTFLAQSNPPDLSDRTWKERSPVTRTGQCFTESGYLWFQKEAFVRWMRDMGHFIGVGDIAHKFRRAGLNRKTIAIILEDGQTSKSYWYIKKKVLNEKIRRMLDDDRIDTLEENDSGD